MESNIEKLTGQVAQLNQDRYRLAIKMKVSPKWM